ncbi:MAG: YkvA family protein [Tumebacillaceae bacterium]
MSWLDALKQRARQLKRQVYTLYYACRDPRVSIGVKLFAACVVAYAFSPIDLIPDFIPVLGYLDDLILVPLGVYLALKMIPPFVREDCAVKADELIKRGKPKNWWAGALIILLWLAVAAWLAVRIWQ